MRGLPGQNTRPIAIQFTGHDCINALTTERSFESQATWVIYVIGFFIWYPWVFVQPRTDRCPVDWCRN